MSDIPMEKTDDANRLHRIALELLPTVYSTAMATAESDGLFQHTEWRTGLVLDAYLLAESYIEVVEHKHEKQGLPKSTLKI